MITIGMSAIDDGTALLNTNTRYLQNLRQIQLRAQPILRIP